MGGRASGTLWLVGMMGAGKTVVGRGLAERLGCPFVDTDAEVEADAGRSVAAIFADPGEAHFRRLERRAVEAVAGRAAVVALGGGAIAQPGMAELLARSGTVIYLKASPETLLERVGEAESRPLLAGRDRGGRLERLAALLEERRPAYEAADRVVETDGRKLDEVIEAVASGL